MKTFINVKHIYIPRFTFNWLWLAIASVVPRLNAGYNDYELRLHMCELTPEEARAEILSDIANHHKRMREIMAWSEMWDEED